ncbi:MAG TPA: bifunctional hydroxymethylpyrimidine kinase/phosphomethylpyrimidine kinase, partial [Thermoanaerobaculia bacterium]|nr:bifunctional hydroxymethylpyrimidine kinase/phosphomethylpyrimidine kinase [Thermoanaerobaculia bacterium]
MSRLRPPRLLTIAGSDSGGGAGIQADLKTFAAHGAYGMSVVTAVTAQNTLGVTAVEVLPVAIVRAQLDVVLGDLGVDAIKVGMLASAAIVEAVADGLAAVRDVPIVLDPVMVAKGGASLLADDAVEAVRERLLPLATLVTPNLPEAERLTGARVASDAERIAACAALAAAGCAVLLKGGHGDGDEIVDLLWHEGELHRFTHPRQNTQATHGTGCTLSSAIAARLARGEPLQVAVGGALDYVQAA